MKDDRDFELKSLSELSEKMVETNKYNVYPLVYKLLKLALILPVATASVERVFSAMDFATNNLRSIMGYQWLNDLLVTYIENGLFMLVDDERIMQRFQSMKTRKGTLSPLT